jgi:rRNA maturation endonuclease Nob1
MMKETILEIECDDCGSKYQLIRVADDNDINDPPQYCPYCGSEMSISNVEDEEDGTFDELDELDFDDE